MCCAHLTNTVSTAYQCLHLAHSARTHKCIVLLFIGSSMLTLRCLLAHSHAHVLTYASTHLSICAPPHVRKYPPIHLSPFPSAHLLTYLCTHVLGHSDAQPTPQPTRHCIYENIYNILANKLETEHDALCPSTALDCELSRVEVTHLVLAQRHGPLILSHVSMQQE